MLKINTKDVVKTVVGVAPTKDMLRRLAKDLAQAARAEWVRLAKDNLRSSSKAYSDAIGEPTFKNDGFVAEMTLEGTVPNMLENGWPGGDMRQILASSGAKNARMSKEGFWYNIIPFRHGTPTTKGRNVGPVMHKKVYEAMGHLGARERLDHRKMTDPAVAKIIRRKMAKHHAVGRYQGMQKNEEGVHTTFRVISQKNPRGWVHPGIRARRFAGRVQKFVGDLAPHLLDAMVGKT